jgi:hypothetical protein
MSGILLNMMHFPLRRKSNSEKEAKRIRETIQYIIQDENQRGNPTFIKEYNAREPHSTVLKPIPEDILPIFH